MYLFIHLCIYLYVYLYTAVKHLCVKYDKVQSYIALRLYCLRIASDRLFDVYRWQHPAWFFFFKCTFPLSTP